MGMSERNNSFATLRRYLRPRAPVERCELCSAELAPGHQHLIEPLSRKLLCSCDPCAILFSGQESRQPGKYRRVPQRLRFLQDFRLNDGQWEGLMIPINMAFFFYSSAAGKVVALYPSPAGATESLLPLEAWEEIVEQNPILTGMEPDVEALLINRTGRAGRERNAGAKREGEYFLIPIDECYRLTGLIRARWRGLSGGSEVWEEIERFYTDLKERSTVVKEAYRA
jgi:hypothetical protein